MSANWSNEKWETCEEHIRSCGSQHTLLAYYDLHQILKKKSGRLTMKTVEGCEQPHSLFLVIFTKSNIQLYHLILLFFLLAHGIHLRNE
jgi:hypothetical protein